MSPEAVGLIGVAVLLILLFLGVWIGIAMAFVGFLGIICIAGAKNALLVMGSVPYGAISNENVACVPLFILMGAVLSNTGLAKEIYSAAYKWLGRFRGGLALATVCACGAFAAVCGSSPATAATVGKVAFPEMKKYGYDTKLIGGAVAAGGTIGILIPPSLAFILYGLLTEQSIGKLFMAGIIPGVLEVLFYMVTIWFLCRLNPSLGGSAAPKVKFTEQLAALKYLWPVACLFLLVIGGIYGGFFTATEAGALGAFGAIIISIISKKINRENFVASLLETAQTTAMLVVIICGAFIFNTFMALSLLPEKLAVTIGGLDVPPLVILILIIFLYFILGMFLDAPSMVVLTLPILFPVILSLGFDPIWYGVIMVRVIEVGLITPPVGMNVYVLSSVTDVPVSTIFKGIIPFFIADIFHIALLVAFPAISLFLPSRM